MREVNEWHEYRQRHAQVDIKRRRDQPERSEHQYGGDGNADHHPGTSALARQVVANPAPHRVGQSHPVAIADVLKGIRLHALQHWSLSLNSAMCESAIFPTNRDMR